MYKSSGPGPVRTVDVGDAIRVKEGARGSSSLGGGWS